ncbi:H/ACA ribonucleoprotein complex subunit 2-like protein [Acropora cervicornis]|uniref:H/ACA ribonucleoprotein complex subunit 2-like protein n=1 Tax=Acropora cervicornis TaxID=6130 RepID=A0AAD9R3C1_ACRCE|nr:H/ACA ribonucleoprotein complex subunit 2-like protein [Acropora cervicornis]
MAKSKDKRRDSENGEKNGDKDETVTEQPTLDYDELVKRVCVIARPLAGRKLTKRLYKTVKKGLWSLLVIFPPLMSYHISLSPVKTRRSLTLMCHPNL